MNLPDSILDHLSWLGSAAAALTGLLTRRRWWPGFWRGCEAIVRPYATIARLMLANRDLRLDNQRQTRRAETAEENTAAVQEAFEKAMMAANVLMKGAEEVQKAKAAGLLVTLAESLTAPTNSPTSSSNSPPKRGGPLEIP